MKKFIPAVVALTVSSASTFAADMPVKYRPAIAPAFSWTGTYVGASAGYGWDRTSDDYVCRDPNAGRDIFGGCGFGPVPVLGGTVPPPTSFRGSGWLAGLQTGYNYQMGAAVVGVEVDYSWSRIRGDGISNFLLTPLVAGGPSNIVSKQNLDSFGTIRGRLGWLPTQQWLIYATGGVAFGHANRDVALNAPNAAGTGLGFRYACTAGLPCFLGSANQSTIGWTVGAGSELAIASNVTVKAEYLYANLPGASLTGVAVNAGAFTPSSFQATYDHTELHVARIGINYLFNAAPMR